MTDDKGVYLPTKYLKDKLTQLDSMLENGKITEVEYLQTSLLLKIWHEIIGFRHDWQNRI